MKICDRGGHTQASTGACASLNELTEDRKLYVRVNELLREVGDEVYDVTPPESYSFPSELNYGINKTNSINPELFFSIHFNSRDGAKGSEICVYPNTQLCNVLGNKILNNLSNLGFINRGLKPRTDLGELTSINCPSMIIEVCFVQEPDASLYRSLGVEKVARAIANGIDSRVSLDGTNSENNENKEEDIDMGKIVVYMNDIDKRSAEYLADYLVCPIMDGRRTPFDYSKYSEVHCVGGEKGQFTCYCTNHITGNNRYDTMQSVLNFIG